MPLSLSSRGLRLMTKGKNFKESLKYSNFPCEEKAAEERKKNIHENPTKFER